MLEEKGVDQKAEKVENHPNLRNPFKGAISLVLKEIILPLLSYNIIFLGYAFYLLIAWWHGGACEIVSGTHRIWCPIYR